MYLEHILLYTLPDLLILNITVYLQYLDSLYQIMMNINLPNFTSLKSMDYVANFDNVVCNKTHLNLICVCSSIIQNNQCLKQTL